MQSLVLGTAQWGSAYGITNDVGRPDDVALAGLVAEAREGGIEFIDTAASYGDAEERLRPMAADFKVSTKVSGCSVIGVKEQLEASLARLGQERLRCCLIHDWSDLTSEQATQAAEALEQARDRGLVEVVGFSGYSEEDIAAGLSCFEDLGAVQIPVNFLDRRLMGSALIGELGGRGVEVQARSIFLQGLLATRSRTTVGVHDDVVRFHDHCEVLGLRSLDVALAFVRSQTWVTHVVVGATSGMELREIIEAWTTPAVALSLSVPGSEDLDLIDPRRWPASTRL